MENSIYDEIRGFEAENGDFFIDADMNGFTNFTTGSQLTDFPTFQFMPEEEFETNQG
jgi:hypothetical protein